MGMMERVHLSNIIPMLVSNGWSRDAGAVVTVEIITPDDKTHELKLGFYNNHENPYIRRNVLVSIDGGHPRECRPPFDTDYSAVVNQVYRLLEMNKFEDVTVLASEPIWDNDSIIIPSGLSISQAISQLKSTEDPLVMKRDKWSDNKFVVYMSELKLPPYNTEGTARKVNDRTAKFIGESTPLNSQPYLAMYEDGYWNPGWLPSQSDLLTNDWIVGHAGGGSYEI